MLKCLVFQKTEPCQQYRIHPSVGAEKRSFKYKISSKYMYYKMQFLFRHISLQTTFGDRLEFMSRAIIFHSIENPTLDCQT